MILGINFRRRFIPIVRKKEEKLVDLKEGLKLTMKKLLFYFILYKYFFAQDLI